MQTRVQRTTWQVLTIEREDGEDLTLEEAREVATESLGGEAWELVDADRENYDAWTVFMQRRAA
jgi:hypothetical protein